jgi:hemoglobin
MPWHAPGDGRKIIRSGLRGAGSGGIGCAMDSPAPNIDFLFSHLGEARIAAMVAAFYRRIPGDDLLGPMYPPDDLAGAERRLRAFIIQRLGGPRDYEAERGHPRLRMRHAPFAIGVAERDRWLELMDAAMADAGIPEDAAPVLRGFFTQVAGSLRNR